MPPRGAGCLLCGFVGVRTPRGFSDSASVLRPAGSVPPRNCAGVCLYEAAPTRARPLRRRLICPANAAPLFFSFHCVRTEGNW
ncbi:hypothetical protein NDU88_001080 [Pleurodeles waltl]|uniref:Secreted protein n=1 Tax=Pleurodeles waltl TaxID=8319 RepID=A0AAV7SY92_PLEWA|nr:hypothetical protein NDU88_001080 [Pleurodeles waltl]